MKIVTWNVNGVRARQAQLHDLLAVERPDVVCLQEIKAAPDQLPFDLHDVDGYHAHWHGAKGYSGVALLVARGIAEAPPACTSPPFDFEQRILTARLATTAGPVTVASVYVPNGGKDYDAKLRFLDALDTWASDMQRAGEALILCGDLNVARTDRDVHPKERRPNQVGTRPDERAVFEHVLSRGLVDVGRALDPDNEALFTWWPPWRSLRQKNVGWRIDYVVASEALARAATRSVVQREFGTSDHAPLVVEFAFQLPAASLPA
ncbi:MAG: exodeoxyribonuclease III [Vicinamibacterales bacterium]